MTTSMTEDPADLRWVERALREARRRNDPLRVQALYEGAAASALERRCREDGLTIARWLVERAPEQLRFAQGDAERGVTSQELVKGLLLTGSLRCVEPVMLELAWDAGRARALACDCAEAALPIAEAVLGPLPKIGEALSAARRCAAGEADAEEREVYAALIAELVVEPDVEASHHAREAAMAALTACRDAVGPEVGVLGALHHGRRAAGLDARRGLKLERAQRPENREDEERPGLFSGMRRALSRVDPTGIGRAFVEPFASALASTFSYFDQLTRLTREGEAEALAWQTERWLYHVTQSDT